MTDSGKNATKKELLEDSITTAAIKIVLRLLDEGSISVDDLSEEAAQHGALLNSYLNQINQVFFDQVMDQLIIVSDDVVKLDEYYVDNAKDYIKGVENGH